MTVIKAINMISRPTLWKNTVFKTLFVYIKPFYTVALRCMNITVVDVHIE